jgi:hypothetical protein
MGRATKRTENTVSLVQELGAQLRGAAESLPVGEVAGAAERLRGAVQLLAWVRHESVRGIGITPLTAAVDHLDQAIRALLVAQEDVAAYLAALGLAGDAVAVTQPVERSRPLPRPEDEEQPTEEERAQVAPLRGWWSARVDHLTGYDPEPAPERADDTDSAELLRRVAGHTDRDALRTELRRVEAPAGLGLAALAPTAIRRLAGEILGHPPGPDDLPALRDLAGGRVRGLLPNADDTVADTLLGRVCRVPETRTTPTHPADSAIAGSVLTGVFLQRAGRDPSTLDRYLMPEPAHA